MRPVQVLQCWRRYGTKLGLSGGFVRRVREGERALSASRLGRGECHA